VPPEKLHGVEADLAAAHERLAGGLDRAQAAGVVDEVIEPSDQGSDRRGHRRGTAAPRQPRQHPAVTAVRRG